MKISSNCNEIFLKAFSNTMYLFSILGILGLFVNFQELMNSNWKLLKKIIIAIVIFVIVYVCVLLITIIFYWIFVRKIKVFTNGTNHSIYLCYGDIFKFKRKKSRNIVIPVNRCFDVIVNNTLISEKSIHGQFLKKIFQSSNSEESINTRIQKELEDQNYQFKILERENKKEGNLKRYESGSLVTIPIDNINYFLFGECYLDENLKAQTTFEDYTSNILKLTKYCNNHSQGNPVILPLIGGGFARLGMDYTDILNILIDNLIANKKDFVSDFYIIVKDDIPITKFRR